MKNLEEIVKNDKELKNQLIKWFELTSDIIASLKAMDYEEHQILKILRSILTVKNLKYFE